MSGPFQTAGGAFQGGGVFEDTTGVIGAGGAVMSPLEADGQGVAFRTVENILGGRLPQRRRRVPIEAQGIAYIASFWAAAAGEAHRPPELRTGTGAAHLAPFTATAQGARDLDEEELLILLLAAA